MIPAEVNGAATLSVAGVHKAYGGGVLALDGVSFAVQPGETLCLLGPNGAGKSTTLAIVLGFIRPDAGTVTVAGIDALAEPARARRSLAFVPETVALWGELTAAEHVHVIGDLVGRAADPEEVLSQAGLEQSAFRRKVATYSKGMRQKLAIALAMMKQPAALLLDEPTSGLDPESAEALVGRIRDLTSRGCAVLLTTHDLLRAQRIADRIAILASGRIVAEGHAESFEREELLRFYLESLACEPTA